MENSKKMILDMARRAIGCTDPIIKLNTANSDSTAILDCKFFRKMVDASHKEKFEVVGLSNLFDKTGAFTIAYFYPKIGEPFIIKDKFRAIYKFCTSSPMASIVHMRIYEKKGIRNFYKVTGIKGEVRNTSHSNEVAHFPTYSIQIKKDKRSHRYTLEVNDIFSSSRSWNSTPLPIFSKTLRRVPRRWMRELDPYVI